jgi:hypothetical protein
MTLMSAPELEERDSLLSIGSIKNYETECKKFMRNFSKSWRSIEYLNIECCCIIITYSKFLN